MEGAELADDPAARTGSLDAPRAVGSAPDVAAAELADGSPSEGGDEAHTPPEEVDDDDEQPAAHGVADTATAEPAPDASRFAFRTTMPLRMLGASSPAMHAANLSPASCSTELRTKKLPFARAPGPAPGVALPVRITGPLHGVHFATPGKKSVYGKLDCRLALVLERFAEVLEKHHVAKVFVDNLYRPHARLAGRRVKSQHRYGLAMDVMGFELEDGTRLIVERDFGAELGRPPCGPESTLPVLTEAALELRNLVCDVVRAGVFHHVLTPNFNRAHRNHFHLDIKRGERRSLSE